MTILGLYLTVFFAGCATVPHNQTMSGQLDQLMGQPFQQAIMEYGPPTAIYLDGADGRILHWQSISYSVVPAMNYTTRSGQATLTWNQVLWSETEQSFSLPPQGISSTRFIQVYVNPDGKVYHWRHNARTAAEIRARQRNQNMVWIVGLSSITVLSIAAITQLE
jgi:hypothetical protein